MFDESTEYKKTSGLSIFASVVHMENKVKKAPVPHTGWNTLFDLTTLIRIVS